MCVRAPVLLPKRAVLASRLHDRAVPLAARLHIVRVDAGRAAGWVAPFMSLLPTIIVDVLEVEGVNVAR